MKRWCDSYFIGTKERQEEVKCTPGFLESKLRAYNMICQHAPRCILKVQSAFVLDPQKLNTCAEQTS